MKLIVTMLLLLCSTYNNAHTIDRATVYWGVESQCDDTPTITANGTRFDPFNPPNIIAVSRDLLELFPMGCYVSIVGCGELDGIYRICDKMNKRYTNSIDILTKPNVMGRWSDVEMYRVDQYYWN